MTILVPSGVSTYVDNASNYIGEIVLVNNQELYDVNHCGDAALYYLNGRGGYDAFLIEGKVQRTDKYTQGDYYKAYDNTTIEFGKTRYITEIAEAYELHTSYLTDEESERLVRNLFPSTRVWLHLLNEDRVLPVVITDTSATVQTHAANGGKLISYTIRVEASQTADRRQ